MPRLEMDDVIVILPGILGSVLEHDGREVWGLSAGACLRAALSLGDSVRDLALTEDPPDQDDLDDGVRATALVPDLHSLPYVWTVDGYGRITRAIRAAFDVTPGHNYLELPYDWRRDNRVHARRLERVALDLLHRWRHDSGNADARLILVAHSMGGLIARYFLEVLGGWRHTRALVTFGTPYRGSVKALDFLANGYSVKAPLGLASLDLTAMVRSLTSMHQLLPTYACYDPGDGRPLLRLTEAGDLPGLDPARVAEARRFHDEIADAVEGNRKELRYWNDGYTTHPIVGTRQPTLQSARRTGDGLSCLRSLEGEDRAGDGTVPRVSATPPEQANERRELFVADQHASIQNARPVLHHLSSLLEDLGLHLGDLRSGLLPEPDLATLALDLDEVYVAGEEEVSLTVRPSHAVKTLRATLEPAGGGEPLHHELPESGDGTHVLSLDGLDAGEWRVTVRGEDDEAVLPVVGLFSVFDPGERPQAAGSPEPATGADDRRGGGRFRGGGTFRGGATLRGGGTSRRGGTLLGGSSRQGPESAGGGAGDAAQGEATLDVLLSAEAPEQVTVGAESVLDVRLDLDDDEASPLAAVLSATVDAGEDITVLLSGRGTVRPAEGRLVRVPPPAQGEPRDLQFLFRAVELGRGHLTVGFQQGGTRLGTLRLDVEAVEAVTDDGLATARARSASRRVDDDEVLTLLIDEEEVDGRIRLCFWVFSPAAGLDYRRFEATRSFAREERQAYFDKLHERAVEQPLSDSADLDCFERRLRAAGADLGQQVLPDALVRRLWDVRDKIGSIKVVSEDPYVPWELVRLTHPDDRRRRDERFLAEYGLVRAWSDPMAPRELPRGAWRYVQSTSHRSPGKPSDIGGDIGFFDGKLRARGIRAEPIAPQDQTVLDALAAPDFDVLHFSCHGHAGLEGGTISRLVLGCRRVGGRIRVIDLQEDEVRDAADLSSRRPLVFLNACESGRQPRLLTMHGGWPRTFCEAGAGAFVGTSWSVRDQPAKVFAGAFYDRLLEGGTLAEAASAARAAGKRAREGSWLAYTVYGDPLARFAAS